ncbi:MAG: flagellar basal body L-ring protein FlgH [Rhodospirillaceae bacterium]|nr:flagellar basal body L-ring protein FlgH [Rhodospirillaceae bacterium]
MALTLGLTACADTLSRLSEVGNGPKMTEISNPTSKPDYRPVNMPMPTPEMVEENPNSLWRAGARAFFKDHRAKEIGDILTVELDFTDTATLDNTTTRERTDTETTGVTNLLGLETEFHKVLPQGLVPSTAGTWSADHDTEGVGNITRTEVVQLSMAAVVTQILPNGNLVIMGRQEMLVNKELRELMVTGVIRPGDIESDNTIAHTSIAEMRVAYGGRGTLSELQKPRWGTQIWDIIFPF